MQLFGYDFAVLRDFRRVITLSCTHEKLHPRSHFSAVASKLDLLRTKLHGSYTASETVKGRYILRCSGTGRVMSEAAAFGGRIGSIIRIGGVAYTSHCAPARARQPLPSDQN